MTCLEGKQSRRQPIGMVSHHLGHHPANYRVIVHVPSLATNVNNCVPFFLRKFQSLIRSNSLLLLTFLNIVIAAECALKIHKYKLKQN